METGPRLHCFLTDRLGYGQLAVGTGQHRHAHVFCGYGAGRAVPITDARGGPNSGHSEALPGGKEGGVGALPPIAPAARRVLETQAKQGG